MASLLQIEAAWTRIKPQLSELVGQTAIAFYQDSFRKQGWDGQTFKPWQARKPNKKRQGAAILIKSGKLRRSLHISSKGMTWVRIGSGLPYAAVHNDGLRAGRGKGFIMPKRQFAGHSPVLDRKLERVFKTTFKRYIHGA
jgi:phage gpG-like protein